MNFVVLTGNATANAEAKKGQESGKPYTDFGLAVSHHRRDTSFINVRTFGKLAEWAAEHVTKGRCYSVVGRLEGRSGRAGVIANSIDFQDFPRQEEVEPKETEAKKAAREKAEKLRPKKKK